MPTILQSITTIHPFFRYLVRANTDSPQHVTSSRVVGRDNYSTSFNGQCEYFPYLTNNVGLISVIVYVI